MLLIIVILILLAALAAANGANDVSKGVATLVGSGVTRYRPAIIWGAVTTLAGTLLSGLFAERMLKLFTNGIVSVEPTAPFTLAVLGGALSWITLATVMRWPVSTTHAIIGSLLGAGALFAPAGVLWSAVVPRLVLPLLLSIAASYGLSTLLNRLFARQGQPTAECLCVGVQTLKTSQLELPQLRLIAASTAECALHGQQPLITTQSLHWLSSGAVGFARGLNDGPKIVALGIIVVGAQMAPQTLLLIVALAMLAGSLYAGRRVAPVLAEKIVRMNHQEGLQANLATALLVGFGASLGLPMSTTHVSSGAIAGVAGTSVDRLNRRSLRDLIFAWTVTPLLAGLAAGATYLIAVQLF